MLQDVASSKATGVSGLPESGSPDTESVGRFL